MTPKNVDNCPCCAASATNRQHKKIGFAFMGRVVPKRGGGVQGVTNPHFRIGHKQKSGKVKFVLLEIHYKPNCFKLSSYIDFVSKIK